MTSSPSYLTYVLDQMACVGDVVAKRMFGGTGLYFGGSFFGLVDDGVVYLRVDDASRPEFVARGMPAFRPVRSKPELVSDSYYQLPFDVLEDAEQLVIWVQRAIAAAPEKKRARKRSAGKSAVVATRRVASRKQTSRKSSARGRRRG